MRSQVLYWADQPQGKVATQLDGIPYHAVYLVDVEAHGGGGGDADIQDERVALGLQVVAQLLAQLLPWLLQAKHACQSRR